MPNGSDDASAVRAVNFCCAIAMVAFREVPNNGFPIIAFTDYCHSSSDVGGPFHTDGRINFNLAYRWP